MKLLILLFVLASNLICAQKVEKIKVSDFALESHPLDSLAEASYIFTNLDAEYRINENFQLVLRYHDRIKIYSEEGEKYAQFEIGLYNDRSDKERIGSIKAATYNLVDGKIEKTKLSKKQIFDERVSDVYRLKKFALPNVKPGSIIDVYYEVISPFIYTSPMFYFQHYIPVDYASYGIAAANIIGLTPIARGITEYNHEEKSENVSNMFGRHVLYSAKNLKAHKEDDYVLNDNDFRSGLKFELHSINVPNSEIEYYSKSWESIGKNLYESSSFGSQLEKSIKSADDFIKSIADDEDAIRARLIYDYVRIKYTWDGDYGIYSDKGLKDFDKKRTGNIADLNLLLTNLLLKSKIDANPFVSKSRQNGILNRYYPTLTELNYVT